MIHGQRRNKNCVSGGALNVSAIRLTYISVVGATSNIFTGGVSLV